MKLSPVERVLMTILSKDRDIFVHGKGTGISDLGLGEIIGVGFPINIVFRAGLCAFVTFVSFSSKG